MSGKKNVDGKESFVPSRDLLRPKTADNIIKIWVDFAVAWAKLSVTGNQIPALQSFGLKQNNGWMTSFLSQD